MHTFIAVYIPTSVDIPFMIMRETGFLLLVNVYRLHVYN